MKVAEAPPRTLPDADTSAKGSLAAGQCFIAAVEALRANKLRAFLTMLGIVIGVGAVIVIVALGNGARQSVQDRLTALGTNTLTIFPSFGNVGGVKTGIGGLPSLSALDAQAIGDQIPGVAAVSPDIGLGVQVVAGNQNWSTEIRGDAPAIFLIQNWQIAEGAPFDAQDEANAALVCDIGETVAQNLFGAADPVGRTIRIRNVPFTVKGVLRSKGSNGGGDQDDIILAPYRTVNLRLRHLPFVGAIFVQAARTRDLPTIQQNIEDLLRARHHLRPAQPDDFQVRDNNQFIQTAQDTTNTLAFLLVGVASISLIVGGIGIMNIMLVSVTERTREIGIRMAVGARQSNILLQFLIEAVLLSGVGGILGIAIGAGVAVAIGHFSASLQPIVSPGAVALSFSFAALVGIFFGFYPARKASRLDQIEALRYE